MSARMIGIIRCDHDGCDRRFVWEDGERWKPPRITDARARAHSGPAPSFDFCAEHAGDIAAFHEVQP